MEKDGQFVREWACGFRHGDQVLVGQSKWPAQVCAVEEGLAEEVVPPGEVPIAYEHRPDIFTTPPADDLTIAGIDGAE